METDEILSSAISVRETEVTCPGDIELSSTLSFSIILIISDWIQYSNRI